MQYERPYYEANCFESLTHEVCISIMKSVFIHSLSEKADAKLAKLNTFKNIKKKQIKLYNLVTSYLS